MKNRGVARFVVAPAGYGKTSLAIEYAETIFGWAHVFWINAQSPCFVRDLDAGGFASSCLRYDAHAALVVIDDLPLLDDGRLELFSKEVDALLEADCEVVVTCMPSCDRAGSLQPDRIRMNACDLLLDDDELLEALRFDERKRNAVGNIPDGCRIPVLAWAPDSEARRFSHRVLAEEVPLDVQLVMATTLVLQKGTFADVAAIVPVDQSLVSSFIIDYPHLGFSDDAESFEAPDVAMADLASPLKKQVRAMVERSSFKSAVQLVRAWAELLIERHDAPRACDLIREVGSRSSRAAWLIDHAFDLVNEACFYPMLRIARDRDSGKGEARMRLSAIEALCRFVRGDVEEALVCAKRHAFDESAPFDARVLSLIVASRTAASTVAESALHELKLLCLREEPKGKTRAFWGQIARGWIAGSRSSHELATLWATFQDDDASVEVLSVCASWLFGRLEAERMGFDAALSPLVQPIVRYVHEQMAACAASGVGYFLGSAGLSFELARKANVRYCTAPLPGAALVRLREIEVSVRQQRREYDEETRARRLKRSDFVATHPDVLMNQSVDPLEQRRSDVPMVTVRVFGCFEVRIDGVLIEPSRFSRSSVRSLLVLLAINEGRELSRETLASALWPRSSTEMARKNFYTTWSLLRRVLTLSDGTCPYLIRHQFGCSIDTRFVHSDAGRLNEVCRELLFGIPNPEQWSELFAEINRDFSSELMPGERRNPLIVRARNDFQSRLIDALVSATVSAIDIDSPRWGIWFAQEALAHDDTREDAYVALMRAQKAAKQRTAAMMTYLKCRKTLSEKLGIDPSPEATDLYNDLLDSDE